MGKKKRSVLRNSELYHYYYVRTGFYKTLIKNVLKMSIGIVALIAAFVILSNYMLDLEETFVRVVDAVPVWTVYVLFFLSDSIFLSLIPPDLFLIWAGSFENQFLVLFFLGVVSYGAGLFSYYIGKSLRRIPRVDRWLRRKFAGLLKSVRKWGGAFIVIAAILPIPWSPALIVAGMMDYPRKLMFLFTLTRFGRIFLYGAILFNVVDIF